MTTPLEMYNAQKELTKRIKSIPKKNKQKFSVDLLKLIEYAHQEDYDNFNF